MMQMERKNQKSFKNTHGEARDAATGSWKTTVLPTLLQ